MRARDRNVSSVVLFAVVSSLLLAAVGPAAAHPGGVDPGGGGVDPGGEGTGDDGGTGASEGDGLPTPEGGEVCSFDRPEWRRGQTVAGVEIAPERACRPDSPYVVAAATRGTNNVPEEVLLRSGLARNAVEKRDDGDGDGDPDRIEITIEIAGVNEFDEGNLTGEIAPGVDPAFWVFAPKTRGMVRDGTPAGRVVRMPSPPIRVERGDEVLVTVQNTHYLPHTVHFHGVDHPYRSNGQGNDGVPQTSERPILPGEERTYEFRPRQPGTMFYHCHVVPDVHVLMGLNGMFVVTENRSNNTVQTFNVGAGKVRHPSAATAESFAAAYDMHYQELDAELHRLPQKYDDVRALSRAMNREYDRTEATADYFLLNGRAFPYTIRESIVAVQPGERYRLRVLNGGSESVALHTHGHKVRIDALDGVDVPPAREITRDVVSVAPAQRATLTLNTTDDGLHSYGPGVWFAHDHHESAVTNDGVSPGGSVTVIAYESYLTDRGLPETAANLSRYFDESYYRGEVPVWKHLDSERFGAPPWNASNDTGSGSANASGGDGESSRGRSRSRSPDGGSSGPGAGLVGVAGFLGGVVGGVVTWRVVR